jgi:predicted O-methyltransferase YrrM
MESIDVAVASLKYAQETYAQQTDPEFWSDIGHYMPFLREHAQGIVFEIGVRGGASTAAFLLGTEEHGGHVYSIDILDCSKLFAGLPNWTFLQANSKDVAAVIAFLPTLVDLLLIDGDHTREGYTFDLHTYSKLVRSGGLIISHDTDPIVGWTIEEGAGPGYPSKAIREEYFRFAENHKYEHYELPGRCGMGVMVKS